MNAFQSMVRNILEGKQFTDYDRQIELVEKVTKMYCGWPYSTAMIWYIVLTFILSRHYKVI